MEDLFDLPAHDRTAERATQMLVPSWEALLEAEPDLAELFAAEDGPGSPTGLAAYPGALERYFELEDPRRLEPAERELYVESVHDSGLLLRGFVHRLDIAPTGEIRVVDYKSGRSPGEAYEAKALFQMRFYALVIWRTRGVIPKLLQLIYLGNSEVLRYEPDERDLLATERKVLALWDAIRLASESGDWRPNPGFICSSPVPAPGFVPGLGRHAAAAAGAARAGRSRGSGPARLTRPGSRFGHQPQVSTPKSAVGDQTAQTTAPRRSPGRQRWYAAQISPRSMPDQGVGEHPALTGEHRHVVLDDQHEAAGALGGLRPGVGVLDGDAVARGEAERGGGGEVGLGVRLAELHDVAGDDHPEGLRRELGTGSAPRTAGRTSSPARTAYQRPTGAPACRGHRVATGRRPRPARPPRRGAPRRSARPTARCPCARGCSGADSNRSLPTRLRACARLQVPP